MSKSLLTLRPISALRPARQLSRRTFITLPGESQSLTATRILPYNSTHLYKLISDVDRYSDFVPYCTDSRITKWSAPDSDGKKWPSEAELKIGWGGVDEVFTSRLFCIPERVVEALSGDAQTILPKSELQHYGESIKGPVISNKVFKSLSTTWTLKPFHFKPATGRPQTDTATEDAKDRTEVHLNIEYTFSNPIYAALSKAVAPKVAGIMIEAFEGRAKRLLEGHGTGKEDLHARFRAGGKMGV